MKTTTLISSLLLTVFGLFQIGATAQEKQNKYLPNIVILATGGTIAGAAATETTAGYDSGQVGVDVLISAVPELTKIANITGEQVANVGSQNMSDKVWLILAKRINKLLKNKGVDGIVITHGTDTMEETAYFLNLVVKSDKPVVLTGSMRPSTALSADGPLNIYNAVAVAGNVKAKDKGVLVVANDRIHSARSIIKSNTTSVETFKSPIWGNIGTVLYGDCHFFRNPVAVHTKETPFKVDDSEALPRVDIIFIYEDIPGDLIDASVAAGAKGIVTAGVGNGNLTNAAVEALERARAAGVIVVRSTRVPTGYVERNIELDDDALGFVAAYDLTPQKSRILLRLALMQSSDPSEIQKMFGTY